MDIFNRKKLKASKEESDHLRTELVKRDEELKAIREHKDSDSAIIFYIDKELNVRTETRINRDAISDKLVADGYIDEKDISNDEVYHIAFLIMANEITSQLIEQYEGRPVDEAELKEEKT